MAEDDGSPDRSSSSMPSQHGVDDAVLGYIIFAQDQSAAWTGAVMLTDSRTRPLHFAFATPVRPTPLQKLLYGTTLDEYVRIDVIGKKLIPDLPRVPDVMFVETADSRAIRRVTPFPVAILSKSQGESPNTGAFSGVVFSTGDSRDDHEIVAPLISAIDGSINLLEPFGRMREALKEALKTAQKSEKP